MKRFQLSACILGLVLFAVGCEKEIEKVSRIELREKWRDCERTRDPAVAMVFACKNYKKECERRRKELKRNVC